MIFNRLMSAMSIDGIWQNNLIYFEIRQNAVSRLDHIAVSMLEVLHAALMKLAGKCCSSQTAAV